jgi:hypothetical protein
MIRVVCLALVLNAVHVEAQNTPRSTISGEPISADRMEIYQDFLVYYQDQDGSRTAFTLNLAQTTVPFEEHGGDRLLCLKQFKPEELVSSSLHMFRMTAAFEKLSVRVVDPKKHKVQDPGDAIRKGEPVDEAVATGFAAAVFTFSEIVFDASHTHAAFSYSFRCGTLCGHGGIVVYELKNGKWVQSENRCGRWIS